MSEKIFTQTKEKMERALSAFQNEVSKLRTGRATLSILDNVRVDYYGTLVPLNQVATLNIPEARLITVAPWESNIIPQIEKAIEKANIGVNPINDGKLVRIPIPMLTEERRKDLAKAIKAQGEEGRVAIRHARREALDEFKKLEKASEISEDDSKKASAQVQKIHDDYIKKIDEAVHKKEQEIMTV